MSSYLITGPPGSGKTSVASQLMRLGHKVIFEEQIDGVIDNQGHNVPEDQWDMHSRNWMESHYHIIREHKLIDYLKSSEHTNCFVEAGGTNQAEFHHLFEKIFYLDLDLNYVLVRAQQPRDHAFGSQPFHLQIIEHNYHPMREKMREANAVFIDAERSLELVVDEILEQAQDDKVVA